MRTWQDNARDFRALNRQGKSLTLALLVACSVERRINQRGSTFVEAHKCSVNAFAQDADTSDNRISRHLDLWDDFALANGLPLANELTPSDVDTIALTDDQCKAFNKPTSTPPAPQPVVTVPTSIVATIEGWLRVASSHLWYALGAACRNELTDDERNTVGELITRVRDLTELLDMAVRGSTNVDWDEELTRLTP